MRSSVLSFFIFASPVVHAKNEHPSVQEVKQIVEKEFVEEPSLAQAIDYLLFNDLLRSMGSKYQRPLFMVDVTKEREYPLESIMHRLHKSSGVPYATFKLEEVRDSNALQEKLFAILPEQGKHFFVAIALPSTPLTSDQVEVIHEFERMLATDSMFFKGHRSPLYRVDFIFHIENSRLDGKYRNTTVLQRLLETENRFPKEFLTRMRMLYPLLEKNCAPDLNHQKLFD